MYPLCEVEKAQSLSDTHNFYARTEVREMEVQLYDYQRDGVRFLTEKEISGLFDPPGLGKTVMSIAACDTIKAGNILVICPASARINWLREFLRFQKIQRKVAIIGSSIAKPASCGVTICSFDLSVREEVFTKLMAMQFDVLIIDESHFLKSKEAKRTQAILGPKCNREGGLAERAKRIYALSGTPAPNNPSEIWPMAHALFPEAITRDGKVMSYLDFQNRFCTWRETEHGIQITGGRNLAELRQRLAPFCLRRKKEEVLHDLQPIRFETIPLSPEGAIKALRDIEDGPEGDAIRAVLKQASGSDKLSGIALHVAELRRLTGLAKVQPTLSLVADELSSGLNKIVIFAHHREVIQRLEEGLEPFGVASIHGGIRAAERQAAIDGFQNDPEIKVFIGQLTAAGTAISLVSSSNVLFVESSWTPGDNFQAAMRCHRIGQKNSVLVRFVTLAGSLDEWITEVIRRKTAVINELFN
ncbi:MAG: DEAD/DEAH box helicase [Magnetococcales bacterium]|nr:DEAD/DEAH box helicase [Magnetococcales bacterium]